MKRQNNQSSKFTTFWIGLAVISTLTLGYPALSQQTELDDFILEKMKGDNIPGVSACIVKGDKLVWSKGFGWADVEKKIPMTAESIQNIGSISKTVTATAIMLLWEKGRFKLDDDVNKYLSLEVRNPRFPDVPITFRQLLTHRSSIKDGPAYGESYACGDPTISLKDWIWEYFTPHGKYYDKEENFHIWKPGIDVVPKGPREYTNVGFGLLGYLVEAISGMDFAQYCREYIFDPLGMKQTGWYLSDIDISNHAVPYSYVLENFEPFLPKYDEDKQSKKLGSLFPHCLYSFPNYPDGLVRTSVRDLSKFLRAYMNGGSYQDTQILKTETIQNILSDNHYGRGLCWVKSRNENGDISWGHNGGDPGILTIMRFWPKNGTGVIIFFNCGNPGKAAGEIQHRLIEEATKY
jgi:CubicO group peptidase (beta-lactamase class C family)